MKGRRATIVVHVDGDLTTRQYRVPLWLFEAGRWGTVVMALLVVLFFAFAGPLTHAAARVPGLEQRVARLEEENARVDQLAQELNRAEAHYDELHDLLTVHPLPNGGVMSGGEILRAIAVRARPPGLAIRPHGGASDPALWPLAVPGFVTRGQVEPNDPAESHPGIDIAVPIGSVVRAAGGGQVETAGTDSAYGLFVLVRHPDGYETLYGHASRLLVHDGDSVEAGQVIALSGNTGHSSAPHLHFEIRHDGTSVDPLTMVEEAN